MQTGLMRLTVCTDSIIHIEYTPTASFPTRPNYVVVKTTWPTAEWKSEYGRWRHYAQHGAA